MAVRAVAHIGHMGAGETEGSYNLDVTYVAFADPIVDSGINTDFSELTWAELVAAIAAAVRADLENNHSFVFQLGDTVMVLGGTL